MGHSLSMRGSLLSTLFSLFLTASSSPSGREEASPVPVVLWHGMGDSAAGMVGIANILKENIPDVYVHRIMIGGNLVVDVESGFFRDTNRQVREVCEMISADPELQDGYKPDKNASYAENLAKLENFVM